MSLNGRLAGILETIVTVTVVVIIISIAFGCVRKMISHNLVGL